MRLLQLNLARLGDIAVTDQLDDLVYDRDKPVVILFDPAEELAFVLGDELQALQIVAELVELAQRAVEAAVVIGKQGRSDPVELARRIVLNLPVGGDLALRADQLDGPLVDAGQHLQPGRADHDQQRGDCQKGSQELGLDAERQTRDGADQQPVETAYHLATRLKRSRRNSAGSKRVPRYCTRKTPRGSMIEVNSV